MWRFDGRNVKSNSFTPYFLINLSLRFFNYHISCSPLAPPPHIGIGSSSPSLNAIVQASGQLSSTDWKSPRLTQSQTNRHLTPGTANLYRPLPANRRASQPRQVNRHLAPGTANLYRLLHANRRALELSQVNRHLAPGTATTAGQRHSWRVLEKYENNWIQPPLFNLTHKQSKHAYIKEQ